MSATILLIGTFDTKAEEFAFVRDLIEANGHDVLMMDIGILGDPPFDPEIGAEEVAKAGGSSLSKLRASADRTESFEVMSNGIQKLTPRLYEEGAFDGVLSLGGGSGTAMATAAMRELPLGVPKVMVSSVASGDVSSYVDISDITFMYSVADISGLNRISRKILNNAAGAVCGMVNQEKVADEDKPLLAASMFGVTTPCVTAVREQLEKAGYEVVVFHATGTGGRTLEAMVREGHISGVVDITTTEWCDEVVGGVLSAGDDRLEAAADMGIPQVVSCGALDMVNFHALDTVPEKFRSRNLHHHTSNVTLMRTNPAECKEIGKRIAEKLNLSSSPTALMLPLRGVSKIDKEGEPFYDLEADQALFESLKKHAGPNVTIKEFDLHINDTDFAAAVAQQVLKYLE
ncbi:Tm-1-like ATP-binding domain-containing protein [Aliifodinibius sp. S!AR15-10]|uniref:Tm-1-like ATP-binding domain-containing protein n=1 Tax=Aliifodinibius sp. S!AR15-10 TaxID=2950437 RepID=UPI00285E49DD|nr:Tm-1-like ATP-binding domain-containing protein [Aliifodinibius sp. S!AR15-10]MDR8390195.1 Tm-1-like ATP-binding domain-containing protein [Aliifodinibius sp. S!AR15-10]